MNVLNRNMFRNRDSRNRLAQMGGILSSSPELQETAMTFANGGGADLDTKFILTNIPELGIREGQFVKISAKTLEGLNNAIPEVMARHGDKVKSVELMMDERNSALVALAREGDALIGTRVNRLLEQRAADSAAAPDLAPVPIPPETAQISSAADVFAGATQDNLASINGVDIETVRRIRDSDAKRSEAALLESLAPNNAQGQPGGILGAKYPEGRGSYSTSIAEALLNSDPFSGELSPSQTARNQETLRNTLRREEIAQQRADIAEAGRIAQDAADTREAFSVPLEEPASDPYAGDIFSDDRIRFRPRENVGGGIEAQDAANFEKIKAAQQERGDPYAGDIVVDDRVRFRPRENIGGGIEAQDAANFALESGIAKAVPTDAVTEAFVRESKPNPFAVASSPVVTPSEELISVTPEVKKEVTPEVTETVEDNTGFVSVTLNPGTISMSVFDFNPTTGELRPRGGNADLMLSGSPRAEANVQQMVLDQYNLDTKIEPVVRAKAEAEQAQKVFEANETGVNLTEAGDAARKLREAEAAAEAAVTPSAVEQVLSRETPFKDVPYGLDAVEAEQLALREKEGVSKSVGDADQQLAEEQVSAAQDSAEDLLKELSAERATNEQKQRQVEMEAEGDKKVVSPPAAPKITPAVTEKITTLGANAGMGEKFGGDGSIADLTKDYTKLLKSLLGESDEDKAARKGELFMLMGAALMSGKSSNALTNIGDALQIGAKAAIQDRVTRKKRDDTIGLKGFEMAADRIAKRDAAQLALDKEVRDRQTQLDLIDARLGASKNLASYRAELDALKYTNMGEHKGLNSIFDLAEKGYADVAFDKPKDITLLELFELEARKAKYTQEQIDRFNLYYGRTGSGATDGAEGGSQTTGDGFKI